MDLFIGLSFSLLISLLSRTYFGKVALKGKSLYCFDTGSSTLKNPTKEVLWKIKKSSVTSLLPDTVSLHLECFVTGYFHLLIQKIC